MTLFYVTVHANPGCDGPRKSWRNNADILDHIKPALRKKPDIIIIYCGSNDLTSQEKTIENMHELVGLAKAESPDTELVISSIITRRDKPGLQQKVNAHALNYEIKDFCRNNQIEIIDNSNLDVKCLGRRQLYLSKRGDGLFARNLLNFINNH